MTMRGVESQPLLTPGEGESIDALGSSSYGSAFVGGDRRRTLSDSVLTTNTVGTTATDQPLFDAVDEVDNEEPDGPTDAPPAAESISSLQAAVNLFKATLGTGILAMPYAFKTSGLWLGTLLVAFAGLLSLICMHQLRNCSQILRERHELDRTKMDYGETAKAAFRFGPAPLQRHYRKAKYTVNAFIVIVQFGFCCVYVLFLAQNLQSMVDLLAAKVELNVYVYATIVLAFLLPYCVVKKLRKLTFLSYVASALTVVGLLLILVYCWDHLHDYREFAFVNDVDLLPISLGIIMYSFEAISLVLPIENKMQKPEEYSGFLGVLNVSMMILILIFIALGFFGYLGVAEATESSITYNIPMSPWYFALVKPMFMACIFVSYGLQFYVPAYVLLKPIDRRVPDRTRRKWVYRAIKAGMIVATFVVAIAIPHLDLLISLIGALFSSALALVFPPIIDAIVYWPTRLTNRHSFAARMVLNAFLLVVGSVSCCVGTVVTMMQIADAVKPAGGNHTAAAA